MAVGILGLGCYVPEKVVTNQDIVAMGIDTSDEWIVERTGIRERRVCSETEATSDLAYHAARQALTQARLSPEDIGLVIVATSTPDYRGFPSTACLVQQRLGDHLTIPAFDIAAACTGFNYALTCGAQFVETGMAKYVLVIGADCLSKYVDWKERSTCILFGDGAGAAVIGPVKDGYGILASELHADGGYSDILIMKAGGSRTPLTPTLVEQREHFIFMEGKAVFKVAVQLLVPNVEGALKKAGFSDSDLTYFVPHQANLRIIEHAREKLGLRPEQVLMNVQKYGNTSAASIPIALSEASHLNTFKEGDVLALTGFGAGFTWGTNVIRWGGFY